MIKELNQTLIKGSLQINEQYSQKHIPPQLQLERIRILSQKLIRDKNMQNKQLTMEQKYAANFIRNVLRTVLRKPFKKLLERLIIKKTGYKLLTSKKKRDIQSAFLQLKQNKIRLKRRQLENIFNRQGPHKILSSIINKKERQNLSEAFESIKYQILRSKKVKLFCNIFLSSLQRFAVRFIYSELFSKIRIREQGSSEKLIWIDDTYKIDKIRLHNLKYSVFTKILDSIFVGQCQQTSSIRQSRNKEVADMSTSRKQQLVQLRQQLKATKASIDQQKLEKNKIFQERKKFNNANKIAMIEAVRKFQKQLKAEESIAKDIEVIYIQKQRMSLCRNRLKEKSAFSHKLCLDMISSISKIQGERVKRLTNMRPQIESELLQFKEQQIYLLKQNTKMQKLVQVYEKRQPYSYQAEYYQLQYENNVIREMIRCFMREKSFVEIMLRDKQQEDKRQN